MCIHPCATTYSTTGVVPLEWKPSLQEQLFDFALIITACLIARPSYMKSYFFAAAWHLLNLLVVMLSIAPFLTLLSNVLYRCLPSYILGLAVPMSHSWTTTSSQPWTCMENLSFSVHSFLLVPAVDAASSDWIPDKGQDTEYYGDQTTPSHYCQYSKAYHPISNPSLADGTFLDWPETLIIADV